MREAGGYKTCTKCRVEMCAPCNRRKSEKDPIVFMQENGFLL